MPRFRVKGADRQTGEDHDEVVDLGDIATAKAYAEKKGILVEDISFVPRGDAAGVVDGTPAATPLLRDPASHDEYQSLRLGEIADYARRIHFWVKLWSVLALIGMLFAFLAEFVR